MSYELGQKIMSIRNDLGLTQNEFGQLIDKKNQVKKVKSGTVGNWEQGRNKPNKRRLAIIADLGNITIDELLKSDFETCPQCEYELIKPDYNFCPICRFELKGGRINDK